MSVSMILPCIVYVFIFLLAIMILVGKRTYFKPSYCKFTLWRKYLKEKLILTLLVKKFAVIYENMKFFIFFYFC